MFDKKVSYSVDQRSDTTAEEKAIARTNIQAAEENHTLIWYTERDGSVFGFDGRPIVAESENGPTINIDNARPRQQYENPKTPTGFFLVPNFDTANNTDDGKTLGIVGNSLQFVDRKIYKGVMFIEISGSVTASNGRQIVGDRYNHGSVSGQPSTLSVTYKEVDGHPSDSKPQVVYNSNNQAVFKLPAGLEKTCVAGTTLFINSHSGYSLTDMAHWGADSTSKAIAGAMNRNFLLSNDTLILSNGASLDDSAGQSVSTSYRIEMAIEYLYTSTGANNA